MSTNAVASKAINVHIAGLQLLHQLCGSQSLTASLGKKKMTPPGRPHETSGCQVFPTKRCLCVHHLEDKSQRRRKSLKNTNRRPCPCPTNADPRRSCYQLEDCPKLAPYQRNRSRQMNWLWAMRRSQLFNPWYKLVQDFANIHTMYQLYPLNIPAPDTWDPRTVFGVGFWDPNTFLETNWSAFCTFHNVLFLSYSNSVKIRKEQLQLITLRIWHCDFSSTSASFWRCGCPRYLPTVPWSPSPRIARVPVLRLRTKLRPSRGLRLLRRQHRRAKHNLRPRVFWPWNMASSWDSHRGFLKNGWFIKENLIKRNDD